MKCEANASAFTGPTNHGHESGLTKREYFAAMAMQGFLSRSVDRDFRTDLKKLCELSTKAADSLIDELNK